jgi:hypothetical protein
MAARKTKETLPKETFVYVGDDFSGAPILVANRTIEEISDDANGRCVGVYELQRTLRFRVRRTLE